jgi:acyl-coenzyme A thioesterase PaaI-like protein
VERARRHVLQDLGWAVFPAGDELHGTATVVPEMHVPGTGHLRVSILAAWADVLAGHLAVKTRGPRVPVTLELDVHLYRPAPTSGTVRGECRVVKSGRSVFVAGIEFVTGDGEPVGFAAASFMSAPDERLTISIPPVDPGAAPPVPGRLTVPFAQRAGCERLAPGIASLSHAEDVLNASNTINGGLIALTAEEAVLSLAPGATLSSLAMRYLQPARVGPVVAEAQVHDGLARVEVRDAGNDNRLCVMATCRLFHGRSGEPVRRRKEASSPQPGSHP